jgi:hypothetical protein
MTRVRQRSCNLNRACSIGLLLISPASYTPGAGGKSRPVARPAVGQATIVTVAPMPTRRHYRRPNPDRRRALELLAASRLGCSKAILRAHGFSIDMMAELVKAGLATTKRERMAAGDRQTDVVRMRITDAGQQALAKMSK